MGSQHIHIPEQSASADDTWNPPEEDLWFLSGPVDEPHEAHPGHFPAAEADIIPQWAQAEACLAAPLAHLAARLGALDDRLNRGPEGWRHRLALTETTALGWHVGARITPQRLALWIALHLSGVQHDHAALAHAAWAVRRLTGGPGPQASFADFLERRDPATLPLQGERFSEAAQSWLDMIHSAHALHPITRAAMGYHLWNLAGLGQQGDSMEAAVTAARIAAGPAKGMVFAPLATGGAKTLHTSGDPAHRLTQWIAGMDRAALTALRHLDDIEAWTARATALIARRSGQTPLRLLAILSEWPIVTAPMAETLTAKSRAAVTRNLQWMEHHNLIREITGQTRFRSWQANINRTHTGRMP